jgi:rhodanese-related sulfurtransferase
MGVPEPIPVLDVRAEASFPVGHAPGAVNIPLEELDSRTHELPPKGERILLLADDPDRPRAAEALRAKGYAVREARLTPADPRETGPSGAVLWRPSEFLVEAMDRIGTPAVPGSGT